MSTGLAKYADGAEAVEAVALLLLYAGFVIDSPELVSIGKPTGVNAPDIRVWSKFYPAPGYKVVEVKSHTADYRGPQSWPWPVVIINRVDTWHRKVIKPELTVFVSQWAGGMAVVRTDESAFDVSRLYDKRAEVYRDYFVVSNDHLQPITELAPLLREE